MYLLDAAANGELSVQVRCVASIMLRHYVKKANPSISGIIKKVAEPVLSPILGVNSQELVNSVAALIAEIAHCYGIEIFSNLNQTIMSLFQNNEHFFSALMLSKELLFKGYDVTPEITVFFPQFLAVPDLSHHILDVCELLAKKFPEEIKQNIVFPLFPHVDQLTKQATAKLIDVVIVILNSQVDQNLVGFLIHFLSNSDDTKSIPAASYFEHAELPFIQDVVSALYQQLSTDDEIEQYGISQQSLLSIKYIASLHQDETISFLIPLIQQDLDQNYRRALRAISAINEILPDTDSIFQKLFTILNSPMKKEAVYCLTCLAQSHEEYISPALQALFPLVNDLYASNNDFDGETRMQLFRSLIQLIELTELPCYPFIRVLANIIHTPYTDELCLILELIATFFESVVTIDDSSEALSIINFSAQMFLKAQQCDLNIPNALHVIASSLPKFSDINQILTQTILEKALDCLHFGDADPSLCYYAVVFFNNIFNVDPNNPIFQIVIPVINDLLSSSSKELIVISWAFASDILRKSSPFFDSLIPKIFSFPLSLDLPSNSEILGNIALVLYDTFKAGKQIQLSTDDYQHLLDIFADCLRNITDSNDCDLQNISLIVLRLCSINPEKMEVDQNCFVQAINICMTLEDQNLIKESDSFISLFLQYHPNYLAQQ